MTPQEGRNEGRGSRRLVHRQDSQVRFFFCLSTCYTNDFIGISYFCSTAATNDTTGGRKRGEGVETTQSRLDPQVRFYIFYYCYTNDFIDISYFCSTTATSDATGGQKRGEGLETGLYRLEPQVRCFIYFFTCYTDVFYRNILLVINHRNK